MMRHIDLPDTIAVFPLLGALILPRARLPLHIFEPRYLALLDDCLKSPIRLIGLVQPHADAGGEGNPFAAIGCAGRITEFSETGDGHYMITLTGISRFCVREMVLGGFTPYHRCLVDWSPFAHDMVRAETDPDFDRKGFLVLLARYLAVRQPGTDWDGLKGIEVEHLINTLSMLLPFPPADKQALLEAPSLTQRREILVMLIEFALHSGGYPGETLQ